MSSKIRKEQELPLKKIFQEMVINCNRNFGLFSQPIICYEYLNHRNNIFSLLHKIVNKMCFKSKVFFLAANYLDIIFTSKKFIKNKFNIYTLSLASLCLAAKFCELDSNVPELYYFIKIYHNIIGYKIRNPIILNDLKYAEVFVLQLLNYDLDYVTIYDFNSFLFINGILNSPQRNKNYNYKQILERIYKKSRYFMDIILINDKLCFKYNSLILSIFIIEKSINEILFNEPNRLNFNEIMKNIFDFNYEDDEKYQSLIVDDEIKKIFDKNISEEISEYNNYKKIEEKKEDNNNDIFNRSSIISSQNSLNLNFDINKIKQVYQKINICKKIISKEKDIYRTSNNFYLKNLTKKGNFNQNNISNTLRNELNNSIFNPLNQSKGKNLKSQPKIIYSKYSYNEDKYNFIEKNKNNNKKNMNSSVESMNRNINLNKYILSSQKKINKYTLKSIGKSFEDNNSNKNLHQKKLIEQQTNRNYKTINFFRDEPKNNIIVNNIIKVNQIEGKKENSIESKNKDELKKANYFKKINYNKLIKNKIEKISTLNKNIGHSINNNFCQNKVDRNKIIFLNNINNFKNENESLQIKTTKSKHSSNFSKKINDININTSKEKNSKNFNIYKYQKNNSKINQTQNLQNIDNRHKNKLTYLLEKSNNNLNNTLKEIKNSYVNNRYKNKISLNKEINLNLTLHNSETSNLFKTQKDSFYKVKPDKIKEEIIKNQQDKNLRLTQNKKQEKIFSSVLINNDIEFNVANKNIKLDLIQQNNISKKNKIVDKKSEDCFNNENRNTANGFSDKFYKAYIYSKTIENNL